MSLIEDYALIGDMKTCALVNKTGSIDWMCAPRFDSPAFFAKLLGDDSNGNWSIKPVSSVLQTKRQYYKNTMVLETTIKCATGSVKLIDYMPVNQKNPTVVRIVEGLSGSVDMQTSLTARFDYGSIVPWVRKYDQGIMMTAGPDALWLHSTVELHGQNMHTAGEFTVAKGERIPFVLAWHKSHDFWTGSIDHEKMLEETIHFWENWSSAGTYDGEYKEAVTRSSLVLKALTYAPSGGIVAAPTTSLPEAIGGIRNWDYRYCWLRDATLTLLALTTAGYHEEARTWREWLLRAVAGDPAKMQIMYGVEGERRLLEQTLPWLSGYENSSPVRIGNGAATQLQLDVYGEVMDALHQSRVLGLDPENSGWDLQKTLMDFLESNWTRKDEGIWEVRGEQQHFTHSKVMAWVAVDRALASAKNYNLTGPIEKWEKLRARIHNEVCSAAWNSEKNSFTQYYGGTETDAALLQIPIVGFLPADDERVKGTLTAIEKELMIDGFVSRYSTKHAAEDGLPEGEGAFLVCTYWLADNYVLAGRNAEAKKVFERLLNLRNDVGLLAEEYDTKLKRQVGNFPQAYSHVGLINTAMLLSKTQNASKIRSKRPGKKVIK